MATSLRTLEHELSDVLASRFGPRQAGALAARLGWDGGGMHTLAEAAAPSGYSRQRVQQLERRLLDHPPTGPFPATQAALRLVESEAPVRADVAAARLAEAGIAERPFAIDGLVRAADVLGLPHQLDADGATIVLRGQGELMRRVERAARDLVSRFGVGDALGVRVALGGSLPARTVVRLLDAHPDVSWIDERYRWFVMPNVRGRLARTIRKLLAVYPSLRVADVADGVLRAHGLALPADAVLGMCETESWLRVDRQASTVASLRPVDERGALTPVERKLVALFRASGPALRFRRVRELAGAHGLNESSLGVYLTRTPVLQTISRGHYALRGAVA